MRKNLSIIACLTLAGAGIIASAGAASLKNSDRKFLEAVAQHDIAEVETGRIAAGRAANAQVKTFGKQMAEDHGRNYVEVVQLAKAKRIGLPGEPDKAHKKEVDMLGKLQAGEFDRKYMASMVKDHEKDVSEFRKMSRSASDPDVKAFVTKTLPVLEGHLRMARDAEATLLKAPK